MKTTSVILLCIYWNILSLVYSSSVPRNDYGELKLFRRPVTYSVDTTVLLNDISKKDKEIGYKIKSSLDLVPVWSNGDSEFLLKFQLISPQLHSRGAHIGADFIPYTSLWESYPSSTFYAHWKNGLFQTCYLDASKPTDIINYQKSLISLFQFQVIDGENNETDISGTCTVTYETLSMQVIRKIKDNCWSAEAPTEAAEKVESRRLTRYSLSTELDALDEVYAEELHAVGDGPAGVALKVRAWQRLKRAAVAPAAVPNSASLHAALTSIPADLTPHTLQLIPTNDSIENELELSAVLMAAAPALRAEGAGAGGDTAAALAALAVPPAISRAPRATLEKLLDEERDPEILAALCRLLGLAGSVAAHGAVSAFLQLHEREPPAAPPALAYHYLAALALADNPQESVVLDVLKVGESGGPWAGAALLAAAAAAPRAGLSAARTERAVRDALVKGLAKCKDEECEVVRLQALGNLRRADSAELLLAHAERARSASAALAALDALRGLRATNGAPGASGAPGALRRLEALALAPRRAALAALDVRAAALDLLLELSASAPMHLLSTARALHDGEPELRRVFWQRLRALAGEHEHVRTLLRAMPPHLRSWHAHYATGTSSVLSRELGAWRGRRARLQSLQLAQHALLRRGRVALQLLNSANLTYEAFAVEVWTRGLQALAGGAGGAGDAGEEEEAAGGLALTVGGARLPGVTLFQGQGELLGHVWAGRGSEPTPVLRALQPLEARVGRVPLLAGSMLSWRLRAAISIALDAQAQVSLWSRSARSQLELRTALAAQTEARVSTGGAALVGRVELAAEPRLRIAADLDFYSDVALCIRVSLPEHERRLNTTLHSTVGDHRLRRERLARHPAPGRTLALGAPNDATCRTLTSADD